MNIIELFIVVFGYLTIGTALVITFDTDGFFDVLILLFWPIISIGLILYGWTHVVFNIIKSDKKKKGDKK